ncbi:lysyl-tRNA synthetase class 2 [Methylohalomonas lacus]|uniref:Lysyl-tRNA synthetase class 2 n=1 Tax=Methylohalomonas lacus TaxID=398773 RepID=A0AAE3HKF5_9GAMM|nr:EF-P lysine aminoacylase EpmA [Methylohalomonas lacus]MCS3902744.1 lysyl-tRNA synthetase class 2 [Methylohalomonas lacus]
MSRACAPVDTDAATWQPLASPERLRQRAALLTTIRRFMDARGILEVETPLLSRAAVTDPALQSFAVAVDGTPYYLQTSPEFAMKRLLAAGSGPIYQVAKVFRDNERGRWHHPEFTMLEWYRPGFSVADMLDEIDALLLALELPRSERLDYGALFQQATGCDPHCADQQTLQRRALDFGLVSRDLSRVELLDFLFSSAVMPELKDRPCAIVSDFPLAQAALARIRRGADGKPDVAERFELFIHGVEIGNGFHELADAAEQRQRFQADQAERGRRGLAQRPLDENLLAALTAGLPDCCGIAIGLDRLLMQVSGAGRIDDVLAFPVERS